MSASAFLHNSFGVGVESYEYRVWVQSHYDRPRYFQRHIMHVQDISCTNKMCARNQSYKPIGFWTSGQTATDIQQHSSPNQEDLVRLQKFTSPISLVLRSMVKVRGTGKAWEEDFKWVFGLAKRRSVDCVLKDVRSSRYRAIALPVIIEIACTDY